MGSEARLGEGVARWQRWRCRVPYIASTTVWSVHGAAEARARGVMAWGNMLPHNANWTYDSSPIHFKTGQTGHKARRQKAKSLKCMKNKYNIMGIMQHLTC